MTTKNYTVHLLESLIVFSAIAVFGSVFFSSSPEAKTLFVSGNSDSGDDTFRAAIEKANADSSVDRIRFSKRLDPVKLKTPLSYTGAQNLAIDGAGTVVSQLGSTDLLVASGGGDLRLENISFKSAIRSGVVVNVPAGGPLREQTVTLVDVVLSDNGWYGLHFDDQSGGDGTGDDSPASLRLVVTDSTVTNNNNPAFDSSAYDKDGIRVDEGGSGGVTVIISGSVLDGNAAEGIEIDEAGYGDVSVFVTGSSFDENGSQPQNASDPEDGLDVDESGHGSISVSISKSTANANGDEGLDLDEDGRGGIYLAAVDFEASKNANENIKATQLRSGVITAFLDSVEVKKSGGDGLKLENFNNANDKNPAGDIFVTLRNSSVVQNSDEDIQLEGGGGTVVVRKSDFKTSKLSDGIVMTRISGR